MFTPFEDRLMQRLIRLAAKKKGQTWPNPFVAAAVFKDNQVISIGVHQKSGGPHAEVIALQKAGAQAQGASLMITLEPCTSSGKTPPCVEAIQKAGIKAVIFAALDVNPALQKRPATPILEAAGISVRSGLRRSEAEILNEIFIKNMTQKMPWVILKAGCSLDGKIALSNKESKYITHEPSRKVVHQLRQECGAVLVGSGTVLADDPELTVRFGLLKGPQPARILLDSRGRLPLTAKVFTNNAQVFWIMAPEAQPPQTLPSHITLLKIPFHNRQVSWPDLLKTLYQHGICAVLVEGGQHVFTSALQAKVIDQLEISFAPALLGGKALSLLDDAWEVPDLTQKIVLNFESVRKIGPDIWVSARWGPSDK